MESIKPTCATLFEQQSVPKDSAKSGIDSEWHSVRLELWRSGGWQWYVLFSGIMESTQQGVILPRDGAHHFAVLDNKTPEHEHVQDATAVYDELVAANE